MDVVDLLNSDELELPRNEGYSGSFKKYLETLFNKYLDNLGRVIDVDFLTHEVSGLNKSAKDISTKIIEVISSYDAGLPHKAYQIIDALLAQYDDQIKRLITPHDVASKLNYLYRMRIGDGNRFERRELFHMPFELRSKVESYRYSIPGLPCLYLGGSLYVCWEEMRRPEFARVHVTRFKPTSTAKLKVIDFGYRPALFAALINQDPAKFNKSGEIVDFIKAQILLWPLIASCSIKVRDRGNPFKPEYILPQIILQWMLANNKADGIRYFSTLVSSYSTDIQPVSNFVFPSRVQTDAGHCKELKAKFELSEPVNLDLVLRVQHSNNEASPNEYFQLELIKGINTKYSETQFCLAENKINAYQTATI